MPTKSITAPAPHQIPPADTVFDAVFKRSLNFRVELPYDTALALIRRIDTYNAFEAGRVIDALERADRLIPRINGGPGNPNNGNRDYRISIGREGSPVIYLERFEHGPKAPITETAMKDICREMTIWGLADEAHFHVDQFQSLPEYRKITFRFWWD